MEYFKACLVNFQGFNFFYTVLPPLLPFLHLLFSFLLLPPPLLESGNIMVAVSFPGVLAKSHECFRSGRTGSLWVTGFAPHYSIIPWPCINVILYRIIMQSFSLSSSFWLVSSLSNPNILGHLLSTCCVSGTGLFWWHESDLRPDSFPQGGYSQVREMLAKGFSWKPTSPLFLYLITYLETQQKKGQKSQAT